jgi:hypothetical protein
MKIFLLINSDRYNVGPAKEYGSIEYLFKRPPNPFEPTGFFKCVLSALKARHFNPDEDAICFTGPSLMVSQFVAAVCCRYNKIKVLLFNAPTASYILETIDTTEAKNGFTTTNRADVKDSPRATREVIEHALGDDSRHQSK